MKQIVTACAFIYNDKQQLLIAKRAKTKTFLPDKFELLGGHLEFGETLQECLIRELKEELHINIIIEDPFYAFTYITGDEQVVEIDFYAKMKDLKQKIVLNPEDHSEYRWISKEEIDQYFSPDDDEKKAVAMGFNKLSATLKF